MNIQIRKATISDMDLLIEWRMRVLGEVFAEHEAVDMDAVKRNNVTFYREHLEDGTHTACFAMKENGDVIGCGGICYQKEIPSPDNIDGSCGYLMNVYATPQVRRNGVGRQIVEYLIEDAKERKTSKIYLESSKVAMRLYQKIGFEPMEDYFKL